MTDKVSKPSLTVEEERIKELEAKLALISASSFLCGRIYGNDKPFVGGCGKPVLQHESYRCADCTASFHRDCINQHFELDAYVKSLRALHASGAINDWKNQVAASRRSTLEEVIVKLRTKAADYLPDFDTYEAGANTALTNFADELESELKKEQPPEPTYCSECREIPHGK